MALIRTTVDTMIAQLILGGLLLYFGGLSLTLFARAFSLLTLIL